MLHLSGNTWQVATILALTALAQVQCGVIYNGRYNGYYGGLYNNGLYNNGLYNNGLVYRPYNYGYNFNPAPLPVVGSPSVLPAVRPYAPHGVPGPYTIVQQRLPEVTTETNTAPADAEPVNTQEKTGAPLGSYIFINRDGQEVSVAYDTGAGPLTGEPIVLPESLAPQSPIPVVNQPVLPPYPTVLNPNHAVAYRVA